VQGWTYRELGHDGLQLGRREDPCVSEVFEFGTDGAEGAVDLGCVWHFGRVQLGIFWELDNLDYD
jgi:hypothetical protein